MTARFTLSQGPVVEVAWDRNTAVIRSCEDLRPLLERYGTFDELALERLGIVACLFAAESQWRSGGSLSWNALQKALDPHYVVIQDQVANAALQRGIDTALDRIRALRSRNSEGEFREELAGMLG